jgi:hypothetical protein
VTTPADYANRTIDYAIVQSVNPTQLALVGSDGQGRVLTGILKLVQRFILLLLTRVGSVIYLPTYGSTFTLDAVTGGWRTVADIGQSFQSALPDVVTQLTALAVSTDPLDEQYADAELLNVTLAGDQATITVRITSQAGTNYTLIAPIATLIA